MFGAIIATKSVARSARFMAKGGDYADEPESKQQEDISPPGWMVALCFVSAIALVALIMFGGRP